MDVEKQTAYWRGTSDEDQRIAGILLEKREYLYALFFCHLSIEKMLKAHIVKSRHDLPPKIHNLVRLAALAGVSLTAEQQDFLREFNEYQIEGRYPSSFPPVIDSAAMIEDSKKAKELREWLKSLL